MRKKDSIFRLIEKLYYESDKKEFTATELAKILDLDRSNVSRYLNVLVREEYLEKIDGRPVYFRLNSDDLGASLKTVGILCWYGTSNAEKIEKVIKNIINAPIKTIYIEIDAFDDNKTNEILNTYSKINDFSFFVSTFKFSFDGVECKLLNDILRGNI